MKDSWFYQLNDLSRCSRDDLKKTYKDSEFIWVLKEAMHRLTKESYAWDTDDLDEVGMLIDKLFLLKKEYSKSLEKAIIESGEAIERKNYDRAIEIMNHFMSKCESSFYYELASDWMLQLQEMKSNSIK